MYFPVIFQLIFCIVAYLSWSIFMITLKLLVSSSTTYNLTVHQILTFCQTIYLYAPNNTLYIVSSLNRQLEGSTDLCIIFYSFSSLNDFITIIILQIVFFKAFILIWSFLFLFLLVWIRKLLWDKVYWSDQIYLGQLLWFFQLGLTATEIKFLNVPLCGFVYTAKPWRHMRRIIYGSLNYITSIRHIYLFPSREYRTFSGISTLTIYMVSPLDNCKNATKT